jgi:hypothetical protein
VRRLGTVTALAALLGAAAPPARAKKPPPPPPPALTLALTPDQQEVIVEVVNDTFRLQRSQAAMLVLCLDVQLSDIPLDEIPPPPPPPPRGGRGHGRAPPPKPELPIIRGVPQDLAERLTRPWRKVVSASSCSLDPSLPFTLTDTPQTPARLVTIRMASHVATGALKVEWTGTSALAPHATSSRDCTATRAPRGWNVRCGGTWFE